MVAVMPAKRRKPSKRTTVKQVQATENLPPPTIPAVTVKPEVDEDAWGDDGLTVRQRLFVAAMVGAAGGNATKAAEMAGYKSDNRLSLRVTAAQNLSKPNVQRALAHAVAKKIDSPEWVRNSLVELSSSSMANFVEVKADGTTELDFVKALEAGALGQIREYREDVLKVGDSPASVIKRTVKIHDRRAALETLAKLDGKLPETIHHTFDLSALNDDELHNVRAAIAKAGSSNASEPGSN
jgi:hypothetical protein